jgi:hypothetical protein
MVDWRIECHDCGSRGGGGETKFPRGPRPLMPDGARRVRLCVDCVAERDRVAERSPLPVWVGDKRRRYLLGLASRARNGGPDLVDLATPEPFRRLASSRNKNGGGTDGLDH